jgi:hypothetical protein
LKILLQAERVESVVAIVIVVVLVVVPIVIMVAMIIVAIVGTPADNREPENDRGGCQPPFCNRIPAGIGLIVHGKSP